MIVFACFLHLYERTVPQSRWESSEVGAVVRTRVAIKPSRCRSGQRSPPGGMTTNARKARPPATQVTRSFNYICPLIIFASYLRHFTTRCKNTTPPVTIFIILPRRCSEVEFRIFFHRLPSLIRLDVNPSCICRYVDQRYIIHFCYIFTIFS